MKIIDKYSLKLRNKSSRQINNLEVSILILPLPRDS